MSTTFWIKRFLSVFAGAFVIIGGAQMLKGHDLRYSIIQGAIWSAIAATVFTVTRVIRSRRGEHCAVCKDTPEMQAMDRGGDA